MVEFSCFILGGGSGIGRQICLDLSREGANVVATDINNEAVQETVNMLKGEKFF